MSDARVADCRNYSYFNKVYGTVQFGAVRGEKILVGFAEGLSAEDRHRILARFPQFHSIDGDVYMDSGLITRVALYPGSTCEEVEKLLEKLEREPAVQFAYPFFESASADPTEPWVGLSNEFMVSTEGSGTFAQLEQLMAQTKTKLVFSFTEDIHVLRADKNSTGDVLRICTIFNQQPFITVAEPNTIYHIPDTGIEEGSNETAKTKGAGHFKAWKQKKAPKK
ncbi:hypothetical protein [Rufibacter psychrotolerans]|uniref:hypothetical protein n=1 Tax=Rufibacter psychrotolerans TaxID=2812556 RepID=UPI0019678544|nr:hypothetical protein [Rufibacter sp. SYSU D00308]